MSIQSRTSSLPSFNDSFLLYGDFWESSSETPLPVIIEGQVGNQAVIVSPDILRAYQRIIFELQMQVLRYRALFDQALRRPESIEEFVVEPSTPLSQASIDAINSVLQVRIAEESILRAYDEEET